LAKQKVLVVGLGEVGRPLFELLGKVSRSSSSGSTQTRKRCVKLDRPIMYPGVIWGHCLLPNIELLLLRRYDSEFLRWVLESNERRIEEMKDLGFSSEVEQLKRGSEALEKTLVARPNVQETSDCS